jgi:hypothetical protein
MLLSYAFLIPPLYTHSTRMGLQFVLSSHHIELLYQVASTSIEFRVSSERLGELMSFQAESRGALCGEFFAR